MPHATCLLVNAPLLFATFAWLAVSPPATTQHQHGGAATVPVPPSVQVEHEAIHSALVDATRVPGQVGAAAKALAEVLHPHFVREEEIALPPLGALGPLARGEQVAARDDVLRMTDALKAELPRMLEEHGRIRAAVQALRAAAVSAKADTQVRLADELALHAQTEEEVLYPAAILVGELLRAREAAK